MRINYARCVTTGTGYYGRVQIFPVRRTSKRRGAKRSPTKEVQAALNQKNAERLLADKLHLNFTPDDDEVGLDYRDETMPADYDGAMRVIRNFLRRYKPLWSKVTGKAAAEFKYVIVTECSGSGRFHHHCACSGGVDQRTIAKCWEKGRTTVDALQFDENGLRSLAHYITKQRLGYQRWTCSRNLKKPVSKVSDHRLTLKEMRYINEHPEDVGYIEALFPGWKVSPRGVFTERIASELRESGQAVSGGKDGESTGYETMPFCEIKLYRAECPYYYYDKQGRFHYRFGEFGDGFEIPVFGFPEKNEESA